MINLPKGLFILKSPSNIPNVNNLIDVSSQLRRKVDIITDMDIDDSLFDDTWVRRIEKPESDYNYILIADILESANQYKYLLTFWSGYMVPIYGTRSCESANIIKNNIKDIGYNCAIIPEVKSIMGGEMFILFNNLQTDTHHILTQSDPGQHNVIWGNIFRACGCFDAKARFEHHEFSSN